MEIAILNFPGFYESSLSHAIDSDMESFIENYEQEHPEPLRAELLRDWLDSDDRESALRWRANHTEAFRAIVAADPDLFPDSEESGGFYRCPETPDMFGGVVA